MAEIGPGIRVTLYLHYLCPYGQRAFYVSAFKGLQVEVVELDLEHKADWHLAMNPAGTSPTVKVSKQGVDYHLTESIQIAEFFNSFPGPNLYPVDSNGRVVPIFKALVDTHGKLLADQLNPSLSPFYSREPTPEEIAKAKNALLKVNSYIKGGCHVLHSIIGQDVLTMADLLLLPFIERVYDFKDTLFRPAVEGEDLSAVFSWFERLSQESWVQHCRADPKRLRNVYQLMHAGTYHGLGLPVTRYD